MRSLFVSKGVTIMEILSLELNMGAEQPFKILHMSDTHLCLADERNDERKIRLAERRLRGFPDAERILDEASRISRENDAVIIHTGDIIDFVSELNLDKTARFTAENDVFTAAGNHEFSLYVGEAKEDAAYREQSLPRVQQAFTNDIRFSSRVINGVNFVAVDNSYYLFEEWQLRKLKEEVGRGYPVILCVHTPLYEEKLYDFLMDGKAADEPAYLMSVPEDKMKNYSPERYEQQKEDAITHEAYEYIVNEKNIKAILAGHVHDKFVFPLGDKIQTGVGCTDIRIISIR